jgi:hypothetical protein
MIKASNALGGTGGSVASAMINDDARRQIVPMTARLYVTCWQNALSRQLIENKRLESGFFSSQSHQHPEKKPTYKQPPKN